MATAIGSVVRYGARREAFLSAVQFQQRALSNLQVEDEAREDDTTVELYGPPWQSLLGTSARAAWRASSPRPPEDLVNVQVSLLERGQRTSRQLRRTHRNVLRAHMELANRRERERRRAKNRLSRPDSLKTKSDMAADASVKPVFYGPEQTLSSLRHRLLPNYAITKRVLLEAQSLIGPNRWKPERVIDFGIGCGGASAAALDVFDSINWIHGIDPSRSMLDCADLVLNECAKDRSVSARVTLNSSLTTDTRGDHSIGFDLAIFAYTATELPHTASTLAAAAALWEKLRPNGLFVMIEPGTPDGFNSIRSVRSMLLDCCPPGVSETPGADECHVLAPCTHNKICPMERHRPVMPRDGANGAKEFEEEEIDDDWDDEQEGNEEEDETGDIHDDDDSKVTMAETGVFRSSFCSFVHTMPGAHHLSKGEKLSYLVAQKRIAGDPGTDESSLDQRHNEFHDVNVTKLLAQLFFIHKDRSSIDDTIQQQLTEKVRVLQVRYLDSKDPVGLELIRGDEKRNSFGRIIRAPIKKGGHVLVDYCEASTEAAEDGRIVRHRVSKGWCARVAPGMYSAARKARWGGLWPSLSPSEPGDNNSDENDS